MNDAWFHARPEALELPCDKARPALRNPVWRRRAARVVSERLLAGQAAIFFAKIAAARDLLIAVTEDDSLVPWRVQVQAQQLQALQPQGESIPRSALETLPRDPSRPLFDVSFGAGEPLGDLHIARDGTLVYDSQLFSEPLADRLAKAWQEVLQAPAEAAAQTIGLMSAQEEQQLLTDFSRPFFNWSKHLLLHELFEAKADQAPGATALLSGEQRLSYGELEARANAVAQALLRRGIGPDSIVALVHDKSFEMIVAMLGVLKAGAGYLPIEPQTPAERVRYLLEDSGAALVLDLETTLDLQRGTDRTRPAHRAAPGNLAYVIYTSGSTGQPKGVLVEHRNVVHFLQAEKQDFDVRQSDALALLSSYSFDASVDQIWLALSSGARLVIPARDELIDPHLLTALLARHAVTHLDAVPGLLAQLDPEKLPALRRVVVGGETCPPQIAQSFTARARFYNEYGPTETTVGSLRQLVLQDSAKIPIGRPIGETRAYVLDFGGRPVPPQIRGELHIGGPGVTRGYLNRESLTREKFVPDPFEDGRMYRTGDLVAWLADGAVEFCGRIDSQVKLRGFRIELGEIEAALLSHPEVSQAAAGVPGERLVAWFVATRPLGDLRAHLEKSLPAYMLPDHLVQLESFPRTTAGKVDRKALPAPVRESGPVEAPRNRVEQEVRALWSELLKLPAEEISVTRSFFELGGHSLLVMQLLVRIQRLFGTALPAAEAMAAKTVRGIAALVAASKPVEIARAGPESSRPATPVQRRMYVIQQGNPRSTSYNLPLSYEVHGELSLSSLQHACEELLRRHESLRTAFYFQEGQILARIAESPRFEVEVFRGDAQSFVRPFALELAPLFRAAVVERNDRITHLLLDFHHAIADGASLDVLLADLCALLAGNNPQPPDLRPFDFAAYLDSPQGNDRLQQAQHYWSALLRDELPVLELPYDFRRPLSHHQPAGEVEIALRTDELEAFARSLGVTPFAVYTAVYSIFLSCLTGSAEAVFGFPSAGRPHPGFDRTMGMFVNTLVFRGKLDAGKTFAQFVESVAAQLGESLRNEEYPFDQLVDDLHLVPLRGRNPVFDTMLSWEGAVLEEHRAGAVTLREERLPQRIARMDLVAVIRDTAQGTRLRLEYSADLFKRSTVERLAQQLAAILDQAVQNPSAPVTSLHTLDAKGRSQVVTEFNDTAHALPPVRSVVELFLQHLRERPDAVAVAMNERSFSYAETAAKARALAAELHARGIGRDQIVAILLDPCPEMLVSVLGVLLAGAAFLPIDPDYPLARKLHMLKDSGARVLLSKGALADGLPGEVLDVCEARRGSYEQLPERSDLAYVIYTSGSTGQPKGTLIEHRGLLNFSAWYADYFRIQPGDGVAKYAGFGFDASISEMVPCFISGARLVVVPAEVRLSLEALDAYFASERVAIAFLPTQFGEQFLRHSRKHSLRMAFLGGEKLRNKPNTRCQIVNGYGPTEYTVAATAFTVDRSYDNIPIGKPLWNTQILVLDKLGRPCAIGVPGELCIAGASMARGYLGQPALTAEKFTEHPFEPGRRLYRSGDLARWLPDGNLEFLGRIDTQVKVRGFRIELGEIEQALMDLDGVREAIVLARENPAVPGDLTLVAFVTATAFDEAEMRGALSQRLPAYMVPARIVQLAEVPLTPNGKVDKRRLPAVELDTSAVVAPRNESESALRKLYAEILGAPEASISVEKSFLELGGHSLKAALLLSALYRERGVQLPLAQFLAGSSIAEVAKALPHIEPRAADGLQPAPPKSGPRALTASQQRIFAVQQLSAWSTAYNIPFAWELAPSVDPGKLTQALEQVFARHESLRAAFSVGEHGAQQEFRQDALHVATLRTDEANLRATLAHFVQPFDLLSGAPPFRAALVETDTRKLLAIDVHHIAADGLSVRALVRELGALYGGAALARAAPSFSDYLAYEESAAFAAKRASEKSFWLQRFAEPPNPLELPLDFDRPARRDHEGDEVSLELPAETAAPLLSLARARGITPVGVFLGAWAVVLSRLANTPDLVIGVPASGRHLRGMDELVGMFVNTVPLRIALRKDEPFADLCVRIGREAAEAFDRQSYQLNDLVVDLGLARDASRNPLFDVLFSWEDEELTDLGSGSLGLREVPAHAESCKFDLELTVQNRAGGQRVSLLFARKLFQRASAERFIGNLRSVLEQAARSPDCEVRDFRMLQPWEREMLLEDFNGAPEGIEDGPTIPSLFAEHVRVRPHAIAVEDAEAVWTFAQVEERADALAQELSHRGVREGDLVALSLDRTRRILPAILGVMKAGAGYLPIDPETPRERAALIMQDSGARWLVTDGVDLGIERTISWDFERTAAPFASRARPKGVAYVIYTSGSTGKPKGVVLEHRSVASFLITSARAFEIAHDDGILLFSSFTFDASVEQYGLAVAGGARLVVIGKDRLLDHDAFEQFVLDKRVTHLDTVPLFLSGYSPKRQLGIRRIVAGGDICPLPVAAKWLQQGRFFNEYGPTETTVTALRHEVRADDLRAQRLPVGKPIAGTRIYILDWTGNLAPLGVAGDLYVGGKGVARGYLGNEKLTSERFIQSPFLPGERLYQTGDLARWTASGDIDFLGRADHQVKIRGFRIELGEIEAALLRHPAVSEAAVIVQQRSAEEKRLCAYVVLRSDVTPVELRTTLGRTLPSYMVPESVTILDALPVTTSGKIDRKRLPEPVFAADAESDQPRTPSEEQLLRIWSEVLKLPPERIPLERSFFELGGHSLLIMLLVARVQQAFTVRLSPAEIFEHPTLRGQAALVAAGTRTALAPIPRLPERDVHPLSSVQRRLWAMHQQKPQSVSYNMPTVFACEGRVTRERLEEVVRALIARHASLRTSFEVREGEPVARVHASIPFSLQTLRDDAPLDELMQRLMQPFDLAQAPLLRVWLVERGATADGAQLSPDLLVIDVHHIILDGYSTAILWKEIAEIIRGASLPKLRISYGDFAAWQGSPEHREELQRQGQFWREQFAEPPAPLELPYDHRRPAVRSHAGELCVTKLSRAELDALSQLSRAHDSTNFAALLAAWFVFLSRIGGSDDVVVGVPVSGRSHPDLQDLVGMFVNTVPWRARIPDAGTFGDFLKATRATSLRVLEAEEYPLEELLSDLKVSAPAGRNPLFDAMFVFEAKSAQVIDAGKVKLHFQDFLHRTAKLDLVLIATESESGLELAFEYATELFERETIERLSRSFVTLLRAVLRDPSLALHDLPLLDAEEIARLDSFRGETRALPEVAGVHRLFEEHARARPEALAMICGSTRLTCAQVDAQANFVARWLTGRGIGRGDVVALVLDPCAEQLAAMLGVLKAGAAFLPVDPDYPEGRKRYMLDDSGAKAVLSKAALWPGCDLDVTTLGECGHIAAAVIPGDAAYVIYTSGSTGKPKGVVLEHGGLLNFSLWHADFYGIGAGDGVSRYAGFGFDAMISEVFPAIAAGATVVMVPSALRLDPAKLAAYFDEHQVRVAFLPTQFGEQFQKTALCKSLRVVTLAGEKLRNFQPAPWKVVNGYGPTEYTVCTSAFVVDRQYENIPVGKPVWNSEVLILDRRGRRCPIGIAGELCVRGLSMARGYLGRPDLTSEKFPLYNGTRIYRTGDLARFLPSGDLEFLGRIDKQVKLRGFRIEPGEIEHALCEAPGIREAVVLVDDSVLVAYVVGALDERAVRAHLARELPEYMIPQQLIELPALPLTANGKVDKRALPRPVRAAAALIAPSGEQETRLAEIWQRVLGVERVGVTQSFSGLGGHSLKAIALVSEIFRALSVEVRVSDVFRYPTVRLLAERLGQERSGLARIEPAPRADSYPATAVQKRMYLLQQLEPESTAYNVPSLFEVRAGIAREDVERALQALAQRHDAFRAYFTLDGGEPRLRFAPQVSVNVVQLPDGDVNDVQFPGDVNDVQLPDADVNAVQELVRPFDLGTAPLFRAAWLSPDKLFLDLHHAITDGVSMGLLIDELEALLRGEPLPAPPPQLADCALFESTQSLDAHRAYWREAFPDGVPALQLLTDLPRPNVLDSAGETITQALPEAVARKLQALAQERGLSLFSLLLSAFDVFLSRACRQEELAVATPSSGRWHPDMQRVFGMFVNTLLIGARIEPKQPFAELWKDVARRSLEAVDHQAFGFGELVDLLGEGRTAGHAPLADVMFTLQNADERFERDGGLLTACATENTAAKFDVTLIADESAQGISLSLEYRTSLFKRPTMERWLRCLHALLAEIAAQPEAPIESLQMLDAHDAQLLRDWNATAREFPPVTAAHSFFEQAAARFPQQRALVQGERSFSYAQVETSANRLAHALRSLGVGRESVVGILTRPSCELIIAELAVLKAGGAFLPLDHRYPRERLEYTLRDSAARVLLCEPGLQPALDFSGTRLDLSPALFFAGPPTPPPCETQAHDLAYLIYTSGSTGRPKGVAIEHAQLVPFIQRTIDFYGLSERDRGSKYAGIGFDVSIIETFPILSCGGELHFVPEEHRLSPDGLEEWLRSSAVTFMDLPTQLAEEFIQKERRTSLRWLTVGGDRLRRWAPTTFQLANEYGPTEATVSATTFVVTRQFENIPIGKPNANTRVYVLDASGNVCPPQMPGEICLAGRGLARGYLGNEELTQRKFAPHAREERLYRTGDLGRWLEDGNLEFLGRIDSQVKIRGFRIELGEIEQAMLEVPGVLRCVVIDRTDAAGDKFLCGYFVGTASSGEIRAALAKRLPDYMVPAALVRLDELPFMTSGKVDLKRLPEPVLEERARKAAPAEDVAQARVLEAFSRALGRFDLGIDDDFFDFGGTSMKAVSAVAALAGEFRITANDLFRLRTARSIAGEVPMLRGDLRARLVAVAGELRAPAADPLDELGAELAAYRARCRAYEQRTFDARCIYRDVLLTGATGFLGAYLLRDLLLRTEARVHVPVRGAAERLSKRLAYYFGEGFFERHARRINLVQAEIGSPRFGLSPGEFDALGRTVDCVIHAAALTKHYGDFAEFEKANVHATRHVLELARVAGADVNLVSTVSVGAGDIAGKTHALFTEFDCDLGQRAQNHYVRTKLDAEKEALRARADGEGSGGLCTNIFRVGFITADSQSLRFQENADDSGFVQTLKGYLALGRIPRAALQQSFCPVDQVSEAILRLFDRPQLRNEIHHVDRTISAREADGILAGGRCEPLDDADFFEWLAGELHRPAAAAVLLHEGFLDAAGTTQTVTLREKTESLLSRIGFAWTPVESRHVWSLAGDGIVRVP